MLVDRDGRLPCVFLQNNFQRKPKAPKPCVSVAGRYKKSKKCQEQAKSVIKKISQKHHLIGI